MRNVFQQYQRWAATRLIFFQQPRYLKKQFPPRVFEAAPISGLGKTLTRKATGYYIYRRQIVALNGKRAYVVLYHWDMRKSVAECGASEPIVVIGPTDRKSGVDQPRSQPTHAAEQAADGQRAPRRPREAARMMIRCVPPVSVGSTGRCIALGHQGNRLILKRRCAHVNKPFDLPTHPRASRAEGAQRVGAGRRHASRGDKAQRRRRGPGGGTARDADRPDTPAGRWAVEAQGRSNDECRLRLEQLRVAVAGRPDLTWFVGRGCCKRSSATIWLQSRSRAGRPDEAARAGAPVRARRAAGPRPPESPITGTGTRIGRPSPASGRPLRAAASPAG